MTITLDLEPIRCLLDLPTGLPSLVPILGSCAHSRLSNRSLCRSLLLFFVTSGTRIHALKVPSYRRSPLLRDIHPIKIVRI